jgi:hypothetical protein
VVLGTLDPGRFNATEDFFAHHLIRCRTEVHAIPKVPHIVSAICRLCFLIRV